MMHTLMMAIGLVFIFEGLMPFLFPGIWRSTMQRVMEQNDKTVRVYGFISLIIGLIWLYINR